MREVIELLKKDVPVNDIARDMGLHHNTVRRILRNEIWKKRPKSVEKKKQAKARCPRQISSFNADELRAKLTADREAESAALIKKYDELFKAIDCVEELVAEIEGKAHGLRR